jgi:ATP-binding cassette, subfamily B, bacterial
VIYLKKSKRIIHWMIKDSHYLIVSILAILFVAYTRTFIPRFYSYAVDFIIKPDLKAMEKGSGLPSYITNFIQNGDGVLRKLFLLGVALVLMQVVRAFFMFLTGRNNALFSENVAYRIRTALFNHIQNLSYSYHTHAETGDLIQRSTSDVDTIRRFIGAQLPEVFRIVFLFVFVMIQMLAIHTYLTFISITVVPFILAFAIIFFKRVQKVFTETDEAEAKMSTALQENLTGIRVVKAFAKENYEINKFENLSRKYSDHLQNIINSMAVYWSSSDLIIFLQMIATIVAGAYFTISGQMSLGELVAFASLSTLVLWPVRQLGRIIVDFGKSTVSINRIEEILNEVDEYQEENQIQPEINGTIEFNHVSFQFDDANIPTLKDINFKINKGETVAILGKTGSGKSTLAHLLVRLYDYTSGSITIDGHELKDIDKHWIRKHIGIVLQEPFLFSRSIYENIGILSDTPTADDIHQAARIASIHEDIQGFEKGYETMIGERGVTLSGGQRQRVAIARMLIKEIPILIFDDSLSAVDTETDLQIRNALQNRSEKLTKIIITHRIATAMEADKILVLDDGEIVESGTHESLMLTSTIYKKIWDIQSSIQTDFNQTNTKDGETK